MERSIARFVGVLACVLAFAHHVSGAPQTPSSDVLVERILAVAGGRVITLTDIEAARLFGLVPQLSPYADPIREIGRAHV